MHKQVIIKKRVFKWSSDTKNDFNFRNCITFKKRAVLNTKNVVQKSTEKTDDACFPLFYDKRYRGETHSFQS